MSVINFILSCAAKWVLIILGWNINYNIKDKVSAISKKAVLIYPHSSYSDYFIFCLYYYAFNMENFYTIMAERFIPFESMCPYLIPAPDFAVRNYIEKGYGRFRSICYAWLDRIKGREKESNYKRINFVSQVCDNIRNKESYYILISPTGSITKDDWKTGYYYIAKDLEVPIIVVGVDYEKKSGVVSKSVDIKTYTLEQQDTLKKYFEDIKTFRNNKDFYSFNWASVVNFFNFILFYSNASNLLGLLTSILYFTGVYDYLVIGTNFLEFYVCKLLYLVYIFTFDIERTGSYYLGLLGLIVYFSSVNAIYKTSYGRNKLLYVLSELCYGASCYYISYFGKY